MKMTPTLRARLFESYGNADFEPWFTEVAFQKLSRVTDGMELVDPGEFDLPEQDLPPEQFIWLGVEYFGLNAWAGS